MRQRTPDYPANRPDTTRPDPEVVPARLVDFIPAVILAGLGLVALVAGTLFASAVEGQYLIIMSPSLTQGDIMDRIYRAGGGVVGFGGLPNIAFALADRPDFKATIRADGAWLVLPAPEFLGCSTRPEIYE